MSKQNSFTLIRDELQSVISTIKTGLENENYAELGLIRTRIENLKQSTGSVANYPWDELLDMIHIHIPKPEKPKLAIEKPVITDDFETAFAKSFNINSSSSNSFGW